MDDLTQELHTLAAELAAAGVPATVDPGQVLRLVTQSGVCALVGYPSQYRNTTHGLMVEMTVPVRLITHGPHDAGAVERMHVALMDAWAVLRPIEPTIPEPWETADTEMPSLVVPAARQIDCPRPALLLATRVT